MSDDTCTIRNGALAATIKAQGAELCSLAAHDFEFIWQAGPAWPRHAPLLFPIVGRLVNDELRHRGKTYRMTQHGFARDSRFTWAQRGANSCSLVLEDSAATRTLYPFAFRLTATYALDEAGLDLTLAIANTGDETLPASIGGHPAFSWPLQSGAAKPDHVLTFAHPESAPVRRLDGGLLRPAPEQSPVEGRALRLSEALFADDAVIFERIDSKSVRYAAAPGTSPGPWVELSWRGFRELGVWSKPTGAPFLCIEPWHGTASPAGFDGDFIDKPGLMHIAPGAEERLSFRIDVGTS